MKQTTLSLLRKWALLVMLAGAGGSLGLVLYAGRHNHSILLVVLFVVWVLSPFAALLVASVVSRSWFIPVRVTIYILMVVLPLGSLVGYSGALNQSSTKPAFVFLIIPLVSWLLMAIVIPISAAQSRRPARRSDNSDH